MANIPKNLYKTPEGREKLLLCICVQDKKNKKIPAKHFLCKFKTNLKTSEKTSIIYEKGFYGQNASKLEDKKNNYLYGQG